MKPLPLIAAAFVALVGAGAFYALSDRGAIEEVALEPLLAGDMIKLRLSESPAPLPNTQYETLEGATGDLSELRGKVVLLNFWATWCGPCREEMPHLDAVNVALGGEDFEVVTLATGRNAPAAMRAFFADTGVETLPLWVDPRSQVARGADVTGLPVTLLIDREGDVLGSLEGIANWNATEARALLNAVINR